MPIIILSGIGICGTVLALNTVRSIAKNQMGVVQSSFYDLGTIYAKSMPLHQVLTPIAPDQQPDLLAKYNQQLQTTIPDWSFVGSMWEGAENDADSLTQFVITHWLDSEKSSVLAVKFRAPPADGNPVDDWAKEVFGATIISVQNESNAIVASTWKSVNIESPEWLTEYPRAEPDPITTLVQQHQTSVGQQNLAELKPVEAEGVYKRILADRATWLISRSGYTLEAIDREMIQKDEGLADIGRIPFYLGLRAGWSNELDEMIFAQVSRQAGLTEPLTTKTHITVHQLSSPLRIDSQLAGLGTAVNVDQLLDQNFQDVETINASVQNKIEQAVQSGNLKLVSEMKEPFAAAIYEITKND